MSPSIDLRDLARRERCRTEWHRTVADLDDVVATLSAFASDLQNLGGGYVVCGAREAKGADGFSVLVRSGLAAVRLREVEGTVLTRCREQVSPPIAPLIEELPSEDPDRRLLGPSPRCGELRISARCDIDSSAGRPLRGGDPAWLAPTPPAQGVPARLRRDGARPLQVGGR